MELPPLPRTLILDYYDSYTNNLLTLFTRLYPDAEVLNKVVVVKADHYDWEEFRRDVLPGIDCVILSPGPGSPDKAEDIGFALDLIRSHPVPILGVCLGHQAIGVAFGGKIVNMPYITHGHVVSVAPVTPTIGLFSSPIWTQSGGDVFDVVVYNSLTVEPESLPAELEVTAWSAPTGGRTRTIQGLRHRSYPIWGVQYHPESISSTRGAALVHAFLDQVHKHHSTPPSFPPLSHALKTSCSFRVASNGGSSKPSSIRRSASAIAAFPTPPISPAASHSSQEDLTMAVASSSLLRTKETKFGNLGKALATQDVFERVIRSRKGKEKALGEIWLDGQTPTRPTTTSFAVPSLLLSYSLASRTITLHASNSQTHQKVLEDDDTFWDWFSEAQIALSVPSTSRHQRGWQGGWVGWMSYEMKEESLQGYHRKERKAATSSDEVDACWAWTDWLLERSPSGEWTLRGLIADETSSPRVAHPGGLLAWLHSLDLGVGLRFEDHANILSSVQASLAGQPQETTRPASAFPSFHPIANGSDYQSRIGLSRESIRQGDSYELTLTTAFKSQVSSETDPYELYVRLRTFNPAYYSTYISFPSVKTPRGTGVHVLSSSPERFLKIERTADGRRVEMMPIKGTKARVKPGQCVCVPGKGCEGKKPGSEECLIEGRRVDIERGQQLQADLKERAENLMIVDLIRSDLLSCCLPSTVTVPKLIALESYGVHNLVTTVQGLLADNVGSVDAVRRCFPPGSMTGAPKLRSVQLLEGFEGQRRRGIYSGALGYISVDGSTDLSVVIRTIIVEGKEMTLGAGGAITWLSDPQGEWDEVLTKVQSVVGPLEGVQ